MRRSLHYKSGSTSSWRSSPGAICSCNMRAASRADGWDGLAEPGRLGDHCDRPRSTEVACLPAWPLSLHGSVVVRVCAESSTTGDASTAKDLLLSKLKEFGFDSTQLGAVLDDISGKTIDVSLNEALDKLLSSNSPGLTPLPAAGQSTHTITYSLRVTPPHCTSDTLFQPSTPQKGPQGLYHQRGLEASGFLRGESTDRR
jgi:hypothetical protein